MAEQLTDSNFEEKVLKSGKLAMVDFWAEWCGPCRAIAPIVEELSKEYEGRVLVGKLDVDNNPEVSTRYGIRSIPTILFIKNGEVVDKHVGAASKQHFVELLNKHLNNT
ncbi:MAG: thioredoxin [Chitinophagales bacterium]|nr:thioredoxin [Chitinophagales bacterium]MDW8273170.1 thioredoxin [Chitinophagales bacterium]